METLKQDKGITYKVQCKSHSLPYSSLMRWRSRIQSGCPPSEKPGPKPVGSLPLPTINDRIKNLNHGRHRTQGTGILYHELSKYISRRDLQDLIAMERSESLRVKRQGHTRIEWPIPGLVWAFDDMEYRDAWYQTKHHIHNIRDLSSRYTLKPLTAMHHLDGESIAEHLESLFREKGPPLFLKRDGGSNLNHWRVNEVLSRWIVIPINSPPYYPLYNGSIEQSQRELKQEMLKMVAGIAPTLDLIAELAVNRLNHRPRTCLNGKDSCTVFAQRIESMKKFNRRKRKEVYNLIEKRAQAIAAINLELESFDEAWRCAVHLTLQENGWLSVKNNDKCYPIFSNKITHK